MGFVDKLKNLFTEEEEIEEVPVKKEVIHVDIPSPVKPKEEEHEVKKEEPEEDKFKFPVYFDDKDLDELKTEPAKPVEPKREIRNITREEAYGGRKPYQGTVGKKTKVETTIKRKKNFSPSPIISPVYGVLDKNYHKEDITTKQDEPTPIISHTRSKVTIDDVRKKAYGSLEDDLETTLFGKNSILFNEKEEKEENDDLFEELGFGLDDKDDKQEKDKLNMTLAELDELEKEEEKKEAEHEELKEDDLFDLIDSMYEKRDDA